MVSRGGEVGDDFIAYRTGPALLKKNIEDQLLYYLPRYEVGSEFRKPSPYPSVPRENVRPMAAEVDSRPDGPAASSKKRKAALPELEVDLSQPEPPSKKAKRALKKGKPLPAPKAPGDADAADGLDVPSSRKKDGRDGRAAGPKKEHHGVWVGNLPFTLTRPELFRWLVDNSGGSIAEADITRVNLPVSKDAPRGRDWRRDEAGEAGANSAKAAVHNRGFAYVDFTTYEASVAAVALSETVLEGRRLLIKDSKSFEGRPAKPAADPAAPEADAAAGANKTGKPGAVGGAAAETGTNRKIFVGNLAFNTDEDEVWAHFAKCGPIDWVKVATFEDTGKCKGYAWVKFHDAAAAAWAVKGFVKIKEDVPAEDDFAAEAAGDGETQAGADGAEEPAADKAPPPPRKTKTRKWWVNMLRGRTLKIELAEEDQVRYKRRFGKDAVKAPRPAGGNPDGGAGAPEEEKNEKETKEKETKEKKETKETKDDAQDKPAARPRKPTYRDDINVARLTGAAVLPQGKKITFD